MIQTTKPRARQLSLGNWMVTGPIGAAFDATLAGALALYYRCVLHVMTEPRQ